MIYPKDFERKIGFDRIRELVRSNCLSSLGEERLDSATFITDTAKIEIETGRVFEFQRIISSGDTFPLDHYYDLTSCLNKIRVEGAYPEVAELFNLRRSLSTIKSIYSYFKRKNDDRQEFPLLGEIASSIKIFPFVLDTIDRILGKEGTIKDNASPGLSEVRGEMRKLSQSVSRKLQSVLKQCQSEGIVEKGTAVAIRNGRGVIPVGAYDKNKLRGLVHDQSATGKTVYIEPEEVVIMNNRIVELEYEEKREITKILIAFAVEIRPYIDELIENYKLLGEIDYIRARAVFGNRLNCTVPALSVDGTMDWMAAIHPLLWLSFSSTPGRSVVPLDIRLDSRNRILLISGPNAGGKSVCLKTVGLLQYMYQCGFTVPVKSGSEFRVFDSIFIDIGDEQSIENDLSTYSSHLHNMKHFLRNSGAGTLILIDEFGTGTEPTLGAAIAESILARFNELGVTGVLTTHYANLKHFASSAEGIVNGAMMFDNHLMQPLFRLDIGKPGSSFAFEIARKIGLPEDVLESASKLVGEEHIEFDRHLKDILRDKRYWDKKRQSIRVRSNRLEELIEQYEKEMDSIKSTRRELIDQAKEEAGRLLKDANRQVEKTIREIKESQAEKERTREVRKQLEEVSESIAVSSVDDEKIERKIQKLKDRERKVREKGIIKTPREEPAEKEEKVAAGPLRPGDKVRMIDGTAAGEVTAIKGSEVTVAFGNILTRADSSMLERISSSEYKRASRRSGEESSLNWDITRRRSRFKPEIDVRGMRAAEALEAVRNLVDEAIMVQYSDLRILHGKGDGILRQQIREFLATVDLVGEYRDEHIESGGSGITIVRLDL